MSLEAFGWDHFFSQQLSSDEQDSGIPARVVAMHRTSLVVTEGADEYDVALGGRWFQDPSEFRPTVGDWVLLAEGRDKVVRLLERKSVFKRYSAGPKRDIQLLAANVDTLFIVTSCNDEFNENRLVRYLALAQEAGIMAVVVLTKRDLSNESHRYVERARKVSGSSVIECVDARDSDTLEGIRLWTTKGQTVALVGSSGVGKSTLLNTLADRELQRTEAIREDDSRGRHTTTYRSIHRIEQGALLVDVPGIRELALAEATEGVASAFEDVETLAARCRFVDCNHQTEPGCAVQSAISEGRLEPERLKQFRKLRREEARNSASLSERRNTDRRTTQRIRRHAKARERTIDDE
ncbi:MAG: ribosome small subunit-dependent GTPase A [Pseudomonadota bacterium]|nr:ribosome small subunit-dependent GTPase A [Pseudomonadota bacterium]